MCLNPPCTSQEQFIVHYDELGYLFSSRMRWTKMKMKFFTNVKSKLRSGLKVK